MCANNRFSGSFMCILLRECHWECVFLMLEHTTSVESDV